ncbi:putative LRR containing protein [Trachipleistophora hominis]|uniref:Putative LRR containing protein n=1 Tax=Trachipleistophora hominis TaxID=72359 RepID=L7JZH4_TRAHO|nr:putative LRR containing protein [Trachipleistophora hominis]
MLYNIADYLTATVIYIFVFSSVSKDDSEYMVFDNLKHTNMSKFLTSLEKDPTLNEHFNIKQFDVNQVIDKGVTPSVGTSQDDTNSETGERKPKRAKIEQQPAYYNCIRSYYKPTRLFKIVTVPFSKKLYQKVLGLKVDLKFETNDYIDIFKYIFLNLDDNGDFLDNAWQSICDYPTEFLNVFKKNAENKSQPSSVHKDVSSFLALNFERGMEAFQKAMNSQVVYKLMNDEKTKVALVCGKYRHNNRIIIDKSLDGFEFGFLFECLEVTYVDLKKNFKLYSEAFAFRKQLLNTKLTITIKETRPLDELKPVIHGKYTLDSDFMKLLRCQFFEEEHIENIVIELQSKEIVDNPTICNAEDLYDCIKTLKFYVNYKNNKLQPIHSIEICFSGNINTIQQITKVENLTHVELEDIIFSSDFVINKAWKSLELRDIVALKGTITEIGCECEKLVLERLEGRFNLSGTAGFNEVVMSESSEFVFNKKTKSIDSFVYLIDLQINEFTAVENGIERIWINQTKCTDIITLKVTPEHKNIKIHNTEGKFYFDGIFCALLDFGDKTSLTIDKGDKSQMSVVLKYFVIDNVISFPGCYDTVELVDIEILRGKFLIVNGSCRTLKIICCKGRITKPKSVQLDKLIIEFNPKSRNELEVEGMSNINELVLENIPCDENIIANILNKLENVKFLRITFSDDQNTRARNFEGYLKELYGKNNSLNGSNNDLQDARPETVLFEDSFEKISTCQPIKNFLDVLHQSKIILQLYGLTYEKIFMSGYEMIQYSKYAQNLKALDISIEYLTDQSFKYIFCGIEFLNLDYSCIPDEKLHEKFKTLKKFDKLKVLVVNGIFFTNKANFSFIPATTKVLIIEYPDWEETSHTEKKVEKTKLNKLYLLMKVGKVSDDNKKVTNTKIIKDLKILSQYIDMKNLEDLIIIKGEIHYEIEPTEFNLLRQYKQTLCLGLGET